MEIIILFLLFGLTGFLVWDRFYSEKDATDAHKELKDAYQKKEESYTEKITDITAQLEKAKSKRDELSGYNKQMHAQLVAYKEKLTTLEGKNAEYAKELTQFKSSEEQSKKDVSKTIEQLSKSKEAFEDEKARVRKEDEERLKQIEAARTKMWAEHENVSIALLKELCRKPTLSFTYFENTNLPSTFDGTFKPDFLVEFLGQYIVFDAKRSTAENLQNYIKNQVKSTVKKISASSNKDEIYPTLFFIIPTIEFASLKEVSFYENGYHFYVIPLESVEAILSAYRKIRDYDLAESFDPQEREHIVNLIAQYDQHISRQNAINLLTTIEGLKTMDRKHTLSREMLEDVQITKKKMRLENFKPTDLKRFIDNPLEQVEEIKKLASVKEADVKLNDLQETQKTLGIE